MKRLTLAAIALVLGALALAGCGGSGGGGGTEASTTTASTEGGGPVKVGISAEDRRCLKEKGVELPELKAGEGPRVFRSGEMPGAGEAPEAAMPQGGPPGPTMSDEDKEAFEECGVPMPEFKGGPGGRGGPPVNSTAFKKQVREYVACVRENGYELAEPNFSGQGPIFEKSESESSAFKKASARCQDLLGGPRRSRSG